MLSSGWLFYIITTFVFIIIVWIICKYIKNNKNHLNENTFYYTVKDVEGNLSIIHDSGIRPSETKPGSTIILSILKNEYHNGAISNILYPKEIKLGYNPHNLLKSNILEIEEEDLLYKIKVSSPLDNTLYTKLKTE